MANNTASDNGGGIELATTGTVATGGSTITNCTLTGNTALNNAGANGGGIDAGADFTGDVLLLNDTINANFASMGGGIFWAATLGSTFRLQNTLVAGNFAAVGPDAASNLLFTARVWMANSRSAGQHEGHRQRQCGAQSRSDHAQLRDLLCQPARRPATAIHLHNAPAGQNGPVATDANGKNIELQNLPTGTTGTVDPQTFTVNDAVVTPLLHGNIYANLHNAGNPRLRGDPWPVSPGQWDLHRHGWRLDRRQRPRQRQSGLHKHTTQTGTVGNPLNPQLGPLQNNGGPLIGAPGHTMTLQTELLLPGSPAIGKGILNGAPPTDERGFPERGRREDQRRHVARRPKRPSGASKAWSTSSRASASSDGFTKPNPVR